MKFQYRPRGVCSQLMDIEVEDGRIVNVNVTGGCPGNLQGISRLLKELEQGGILSRGVLEEFLEHGHSSGTDLLYGILWGMKLAMARESSCPNWF